MKNIAFVLALMFSGFASAASDFPLKNIKILTEWDYTKEVQNSNQYVAMIFSSSACLEKITIDSSCLLFEKRMDYVAPKFSKNVKVVVFNTYFENYRLKDQFSIQKTPTVILMKNGKIVKRLEPDTTIGRTFARPTLSNPYALTWSEVLFKQTSDLLFSIQ